MVTVYKSKIGWEIIALLAACFIPAFIAEANTPGKGTGGLYVMAGVMVLVIALLCTTYYKVKGTTLRAYVLFIPYRPVAILSITKIEETFNPLSAPATSIDRLGITHGDGYLLISPKDKAGFIAHMQQINPGIVFVPRKKK
ncbi:PH domain-containing protein [Flavobacterium sp. RHBU_24]|uniref:PH domain-containing protein n=1 Tax=Flavobacterium sp. RHBU_24 TaxID=3391185 RepID=UPI0039850975